jgi:hypothetical protein
MWCGGRMPGNTPLTDLDRSGHGAVYTTPRSDPAGLASSEALLKVLPDNRQAGQG